MDVLLTLASLPTLAVPESAVTTVEKIRGVFVEQDSRFRFVPIEIGRETGGWVEIRNGVKEGDRVVSEGIFDLKNVLLKEHIGSSD